MRTIREQQAAAITLDELEVELFERAKASGFDPDAAFQRVIFAMDTPGRSWKLKGQHYRLFRDEDGPLPHAEEKWAIVMDEALRDAADRMAQST